MRWFTTFLLILLVGGAVAALILDPRLDPRTTTTSVRNEVSDALGELSVERITTIELRVPGSEPLTLMKDATGWNQPGKWAVRQVEANNLLAALTTLSPRHAPIPVTPDTLKNYGLGADQKAIVAKVSNGNRTLTMAFGKPDNATLDTPTYLRIDEQNVIARLGSGVLAKLALAPEQYRRKQLFIDAEPVKIDSADEPAPLVMDNVSTLKLDGPDGSYTLKRTAPTLANGELTTTAAKLANAWELAEASAKPLRDRVDPAKLKAILTGVPDLWATTFISGKSLEEMGLDKPSRSITLTDKTGQAITLQIGKESRRVAKNAITPPPAFGAPPPPPESEVYSYAKLAGNPLTFEIRTDKINDLFPKLDDLRDAQLARFNTSDVNEVTIALKGQSPIKLTRKKGNKLSEKEDEKQDRWYVGEILAENGKVTELLDALAKLEAKNPPAPMNDPLVTAKPSVESAIIDAPDAKKLTELGLEAMGSTITLITQEKAVDGQPTPAPKTTVLKLGKHDAEKKKLVVQVGGWERVNLVADDVKKLIDRPTLAYRGRRLFDTADKKLASIEIVRPDSGSFALAKGDTAWKLTKPVAMDADDAKANTLAGDLSRLEVTEYVDDAPKPDDLEKKYSLAKPKLTLTLGFSSGTPEVLAIGGSPEFKSEFYARRNNTGSVFTLPKASVDNLLKGPVELLPLQLWSIPAETISALEIQRGSESYKLVPQTDKWKLSGPFDADIPSVNVEFLKNMAALVRAEKYDAMTIDPAKHGLDKPTLTLKVTTTPKMGPSETKTLQFGKLDTVDAMAPKVYAKLGEGPNQAVFVMGDTLFRDADKSALDRLDRAILTQNPADLSKVQIAGPTPETNVTLAKDDKGWKVEGTSFVPDSTIVGELSQALARPPILKFVAYGPNVKWADYGLDKPEYTLTGSFKLGDKTEPHVLKLGKADDKGDRYIRVDDSLGVAVLSKRTAEAISRSKLDFVDRTLLAYDPAQLNGFIRKTTNEELEIVPGATAGWDIVKPAKQKGDQTILDDLNEQLSKLRASKVAAYGTKDLKPFGLDNPTATITLKVGLENPKDTVLKIGKAVDDKQPNGDRFAMVDGKAEPTVGVIGGAIAKKLLAESLKFRDRELVVFKDADRAELVRGERTVLFAKVDGTWKLVKPIEAEAEQGELDELLTALAKLRAEELIAEKPKDLKPYGLDKPSAKWSFKNGEKDVLSFIVGKTENGRAYAKLEKSEKNTTNDYVVALDAATTTKILAEYRKRSVWTGVDASQVEAIEIKAGERVMTLRKLGMTWVDSAKATDAIDAAKVSEFLESLAGLKAARYVVDKDADLKLYGLQPPQRVITLSLRGEQRTIHIGHDEGGSDGKRVYAKIEGKDRSEVFVLSEADTTKLTRDRAAFVQKK